MTIYPIENKKMKVNNSYSLLLEIFFEAPRGSILGPLLFNTFATELFTSYSLLLTRSSLPFTRFSLCFPCY